MLRENIYFIFQITFRFIFGLFIHNNKDLQIALLRKENIILKRKIKKVKLNNWDRFYYLFIYHNFKQLIDDIMLVKPATILSWHKKLVSKKWDYSKKRVGRPKISDEIKKVIAEMKKENPRWGSKKIAGELMKLGTKVCKKTVSKILKEYGFDATPKTTSYSWFSFLKSQGKRFWACDFFTAETLFLQTLYVYFIIDIKTRAIILFGVTSNPNEDWLKNIIRSHFAFIDNLPDVIISDRDGIYGKSHYWDFQGSWLKLFLIINHQVKLIKTPPQFPICNSFAERFIRTIRNESIDYMLIYNQKDLEKVLNLYIDYYNCQRTHSSIDFNAPKNDFSKFKRQFQLSKVKKEKILNGLITDFSLAAA